jgi:arylsulfatase A-like enzyme/Flp pilus assembly protein TadD
VKKPGVVRHNGPWDPWRRLSKAVLVLILGFAGGCERGGEQPSVLLVIIDTLRADYVGCYGASTRVTPNADRLAGEGVRFSQCVTSIPVTLPSVSAILTSSYPIYNGVRDNGTFTLDGSLTTLQEVLRESGYSTGAFVSAYVVAEGSGIEQGFDHFDSEFSGAYSLKSSIEPAMAKMFAETQSRADEITERSIEWLRGAQRPFFLLVHYYDPHTPYDPPPEFRARWPENPYLGEVAFTDVQLGRLLEAAEDATGSAGLVTALVGDHGEGLGQHKEQQHGIFIYDSTLHVPFIIRSRGMVSEGLVVEEQVSTIDLAPTVLDLAGVGVPDSWQGVSHARGTRLDPERASTGAAEPRPCYIESHRGRFSYNWSELVGVRQDGWKFIRAPRPELYDLANDPAEETNLYDSNPDRARLLESTLQEMLDEYRGHLAETAPKEDLDEEEIEKLRTLGYVMSGKHSDGDLPDPKDMIDEYNESYEVGVHVARAKSLLGVGDVSGAKRHFEIALGLDPDCVEALTHLGILLCRQGDCERGVVLLESAARQNPASSKAHFNLGIAYMGLGRYHDAAEQFEVLVAVEPENADSWYRFGVALQEAGKLEEAIDKYSRCLELDPAMAMALYDSAVILAGLGRTTEAKERLAQVLSVSDGQLAAQAKALLERLQSEQ